MELPQTNVDEALVVALNPWFLHIASKTAVEQQLSPHQGMHTHRNTFTFFPNFFHLFSLSTIRAKSLESQTRMSQKSGTSRCVISHGSYFDKLYVEKIYVFCFLFFIRVLFWLGFLLCWKDICFLISVFDNQFLISVFWFLISDFCFLISIFWFLFSDFWYQFSDYW